MIKPIERLNGLRKGESYEKISRGMGGFDLAGLGLRFGQYRVSELCRDIVQSTGASWGGSRLIFKRKVKVTDSDRYLLDDKISPCGGDSNWDYSMDIESSVTSFQIDVEHVVTDFDLSGCTGGGYKDKASLDDGTCRIKYIRKFDKTFTSVSGLLSFKCTAPIAVAGTIQDAYLWIFRGFYDPYVNTCFISSAAFPACNFPAVVKADGSNGKSVKMSDAPSASCENC